MKTKLLVGLLLVGGSLFAETHVSIGIGSAGYRNGYYAPPPPPVYSYRISPRDNRYYENRYNSERYESRYKDYRDARRSNDRDRDDDRRDGRDRNGYRYEGR